ncbi:MAG: hypothetical protein OEL89_00055 [Candidatus Peregrinibacteria bacterium]|nr:hypothetical protein [Candidatus Peregrinibacteria bacterium]
MSYYQTITPLQLRFIDQQIHSVAWNQAKFLNFFQKSPGARVTKNAVTGALNVDGGLIRNVEEGLEQITLTNWEKMKPGQISGGLQDIPTQYVKLYQETQPLMYLATKISIPVNFTHAWENNNLIEAKDILNSALEQTMKPLINQVDQFICYGDDMLTPISHDPMKSAGKFTGLFNGFQSFSGGDTGDDNVAAAGDYIATYINGRKNLHAQGFDTGPYFILSDYVTAAAAEQGNNLYKTYAPVTEKRHMLNEYKDELMGWVDSINAFPASSTSQYRMCVTQPFISQQGNKIEPAYALYVGYNFRVFNLWAGGLNGSNMSYEFVIAWSGRIQPIGSSGAYSLYHTGATADALTIS